MAKSRAKKSAAKKAGGQGKAPSAFSSSTAVDEEKPDQIEDCVGPTKGVKRKLEEDEVGIGDSKQKKKQQAEVQTKQKPGQRTRATAAAAGSILANPRRTSGRLAKNQNSAFSVSTESGVDSGSVLDDVETTSKSEDHMSASNTQSSVSGNKDLDVLCKPQADMTSDSALETCTADSSVEKSKVQDADIEDQDLSVSVEGPSIESAHDSLLDETSCSTVAMDQEEILGEASAVTKQNLSSNSEPQNVPTVSTCQTQASVQDSESQAESEEATVDSLGQSLSSNVVMSSGNEKGTSLSLLSELPEQHSETKNYHYAQSVETKKQLKTDSVSQSKTLQEASMEMLSIPKEQTLPADSLEHQPDKAESESCPRSDLASTGKSGSGKRKRGRPATKARKGQKKNKQEKVETAESEVNSTIVKPNLEETEHTVGKGEPSDSAQDSTSIKTDVPKTVSGPVKIIKQTSVSIPDPTEIKTETLKIVSDPSDIVTDTSMAVLDPSASKTEIPTECLGPTANKLTVSITKETTITQAKSQSSVGDIHVVTTSREEATKHLVSESDVPALNDQNVSSVQYPDVVMEEDLTVVEDTAAGVHVPSMVEVPTNSGPDNSKITSVTISAATAAMSSMVSAETRATTSEDVENSNSSTPEVYISAALSSGKAPVVTSSVPTSSTPVVPVDVTLRNSPDLSPVTGTPPSTTTCLEEPIPSSIKSSTCVVAERVEEAVASSSKASSSTTVEITNASSSSLNIAVLTMSSSPTESSPKTSSITAQSNQLPSPKTASSGQSIQPQQLPAPPSGPYIPPPGPSLQERLARIRKQQHQVQSQLTKVIASQAHFRQQVLWMMKNQAELMKKQFADLTEKVMSSELSQVVSLMKTESWQAENKESLRKSKRKTAAKDDVAKNNETVRNEDGVETGKEVKDVENDDSGKVAEVEGAKEIEDDVGKDREKDQVVGSMVFDENGKNFGRNIESERELVPSATKKYKIPVKLLSKESNSDQRKVVTKADIKPNVDVFDQISKEVAKSIETMEEIYSSAGGLSSDESAFDDIHTGTTPEKYTAVPSLKDPEEPLPKKKIKLTLLPKVKPEETKRTIAKDPPLTCRSSSSQIKEDDQSSMEVSSASSEHTASQTGLTPRVLQSTRKTLEEIWIVGDQHMVSAEIRATGTTFGEDLGFSVQGFKLRWYCSKEMRLQHLLPVIKGLVHERGTPGIIVIHLGTNDIGKGRIADLQKAVKASFVELFKLVPSTMLVWSDIIDMPDCVHIMREGINKIGHTEIAGVLGGRIIRHSTIRKMDKSLFEEDGKSLSHLGTDMMLSTLQGALECFLTCEEREFG